MLSSDHLFISTGATAFNCNFESNMCAWVNSENDNYDWTWGGTAAQVGNNSNIPKIDHTTNSGGKLSVPLFVNNIQ